MSYIRKLFHQSSYYFIGNILVVLAGFISFPIWTRVFSKEDYGILSIISVTISFMVVFSKLGLPHAALRFYSDFKEKKRDLDITSYYTTMLLGSLFICGSIILTILSMTEIFFRNSINETILHLLPLIAFIVLMMSINNLLIEFLRAEQRGRFYSMILVVVRYGELSLAILFVFVFIGNLYGLFLGRAIASALNLALLLSILIYRKKIFISSFSFPFLKESIKYSFPLIWFELSNMILSIGDRYLIQYYLGSESVGVYSAGYNLSDMAQSSLSTPLRLAVIPMYLTIWNIDGEEKTKHFLSQALNYYFMFGVPLILGMSFFGKEIITLFASAKFLEANIIMPYIILPLIIHGASAIYGAGLYIQKKTKILMYLTLSAGLINILLNIILIPRFELLGAAYATLVSYLVLAFSIAMISYRYLKIKIQINPILKYIFLSIIIMSFISKYSADSIGQMLIKMTMGITLYSIAIIALDENLRMKMISFIKIK